MGFIERVTQINEDTVTAIENILEYFVLFWGELSL